jgi:hypothetical protein
METTIVCKQCGGKHTYDYSGKGRQRMFCSSKCRDKWFNQHRDREAEAQRISEYRKKNPADWLLSQLKSRAKKQGLDFNLNKAWLEKRIATGRCEMTQLPVYFKPYRRGEKGKRHFLSLSVDRIDNTQGYTTTNTRVVCWAYNLLKNSYTDRDVCSIALALVLNNMARDHQEILLDMLPPYFKANLHPGHPLAA